jgi:hypothetical protein
MKLLTQSRQKVSLQILCVEFFDSFRHLPFVQKLDFVKSQFHIFFVSKIAAQDLSLYSLNQLYERVKFVSTIKMKYTVMRLLNEELLKRDLLEDLQSSAKLFDHYLRLFSVVKIDIFQNEIVDKYYTLMTNFETEDIEEFGGMESMKSKLQFKHYSKLIPTEACASICSNLFRVQLPNSSSKTEFNSKFPFKIH